jgi:hypothetical protein
MLNFTKAFSHIFMIPFVESFQVNVSIASALKALGLVNLTFTLLANCNDSVRNIHFSFSFTSRAYPGRIDSHETGCSFFAYYLSPQY